MTPTTAARHLTTTFVASCRKSDSLTPAEADNNLNDASRQLIAAYHDHYGQCWLGHINLYDDTRNLPVIWLWDRTPVHNFGAGFVLPTFDRQLVDMILARDNTPYEGTRKDSVLVGAIMNRIKEVGGKCLMWS